MTIKQYSIKTRVSALRVGSGVDTTQFETYFFDKTGKQPYLYQTQLATQPIAAGAIHVPTGSGKTAAAILAWLWRLKQGFPDVPRRLVYVLPMRVLVEQTYANATCWAAGLADVYKLMGGEVEEDWELHPEKPAILIGTMDMLVSRMLNRGFGMSRYRWPIPFAFLNNDCLIVCDEVQLMGNGLATVTQLEAWRQKYGSFGPCATWWMSATFDPEWLKTADHRGTDVAATGLDEADRNAGLKARYTAPKAVELVAAQDAGELAVRAHQPGTLTLVIVNTVEKAQNAFTEIRKLLAKQKAEAPEPVLLHSRFREPEREAAINKLTAGRIVVATQVVEAGVDISARTLVTEIAPWSALVQRFGRCNREGEYPSPGEARIICIDVDDKKPEPYQLEDLLEAKTNLAALGPNASLEQLERMGPPSKATYTHVIRRKDLLELFDTTPDLSGADLDISRFIRDQDDADVQVFWRDVGKDGPGEKEPAPARQELCNVAVYRFREFLKDRPAYRWDGLDKKWKRAKADEAAPGQLYLIPSAQGGYSEMGWDAKSKKNVSPLAVTPEPEEADETDGRSAWLEIAAHTDNVVRHADAVSAGIGLNERYSRVLHIAARWHDRGKAHHLSGGLAGRRAPSRKLGQERHQATAL